MSAQLAMDETFTATSMSRMLQIDHRLILEAIFTMRDSGLLPILGFPHELAFSMEESRTAFRDVHD
jgi:hypothetical protein